MREQALAAGHDVRDPGCLVEQAVINVRPSEDSAAALIGSGCLNTTYSWPVATFQTRVVLSSVTVTSAPPSSEKATALITPFALVGEDVDDFAGCRHPRSELSCRPMPSPICVRPVNKQLP